MSARAGAFDLDTPTSEGSWEAGVDGALPGIIMKADPQVGDAYRQEYHRGEAEDTAGEGRAGCGHRVCSVGCRLADSGT